MSASGAQYGMATMHYFWIGAVPAMVFLGIVMMPFYYGSKVRSVPEYMRCGSAEGAPDQRDQLRRRQVLIAGVNLYALATSSSRCWACRLVVAIMLAAVFVLTYITLGGLSARHLQRGAAVLRHPRGAGAADAHRAARTPAASAALVDKVTRRRQRGDACRPGRDRPAAREPVLVDGSASSSASGSCCPSATGRRTSPRSSGRWPRTRSRPGSPRSSGRSRRCSCRSIMVIPGMSPLVLVPGVGRPAKAADFDYNNSIPR